MKTAFVYARYSSHNQTEQSIEGQVRVCEEWAKRNDCLVLKVYADRAITGKTDNRPEFLRMIEDAVLEKPDFVLVYKTDRFSRNRYDAAVYKQKLKKVGVAVKYAAEASIEGPESIIMESLLEGLAEYYSEELSQKVKRGMRESARKAQATGAPPYGYVIGKDKHLEIDSEKAAVVKRVFNEVLQGRAISDICKDLNADGLRTAYGNSFHHNGLLKILTNEKYVGTFTYEDIRVENSIPKIIDEATFVAVQDELKAREALHVKHKKHEHYMLSDKLYCKECGAKMHGVSGTSQNGEVYRYYGCPNNRGRKKECSTKKIRAEILEQLVIEETKTAILDPVHVKIIARRLFEYQEKNRAENTKLKALQNQLKDTERRLANLMAALENGLEFDMATDRVKELQGIKKDLTLRIKSEEKYETRITEDQFADFLIACNSDERIINSLISKIEFSNDEIVIYYNLLGPDGKPESSTKKFDDSEPRTTMKLNGRTLVFSASAICLVTKVTK